MRFEELKLKCCAFFLLMFLPLHVFSQGEVQSWYEKKFIDIKNNVEKYLNNELELYGMTLQGSTFYLNVKVWSSSALSKFMKDLHEDPKFADPKLLSFTEPGDPSFVLLSVNTQTKQP